MWNFQDDTVPGGASLHVSRAYVCMRVYVYMCHVCTCVCTCVRACVCVGVLRFIMQVFQQGDSDQEVFWSLVNYILQANIYNTLAAVTVSGLPSS